MSRADLVTASSPRAAGRRGPGHLAAGQPLLARINPADAPMQVVDVELAQPLPAISSMLGKDRAGAALVLVRLHGRPLGIARVPLHGAPLSSAALASQLWERFRGDITAHLLRDGLRAPESIEAVASAPAHRAGCIRRRAALLRDAPRFSVLIATRDRPDRLRACLDSVLQLDYPRFQVVVIDNDPTTTATEELVRRRYAGRAIHYVQEQRRGLAAAHNRGLDVATGELLAFTDDDVIVDRHWLSALLEGFRLADGVAAVTGLIYPAELRTPTQILLEQHGGFGKGFAPRVFDLTGHRPADRLFPMRAGQLGSGANMAFDAAVLRDLRGFDPAMGTGTRARGGDDLAAFVAVIAAGHGLAYQPAAIVKHHHPADPEALGRQAYNYGVGLGAFLTDAFVREPRLAAGALRGLAAEARSTFALGSSRNRERYQGWPDNLVRLERRGIARGPFAYATSRWAARRAERPA